MFIFRQGPKKEQGTHSGYLISISIYPWQRLLIISRTERYSIWKSIPLSQEVS